MVSLPPKAMAVLIALLEHPGEVVAKETLLDAAWPDIMVTEGVLKGCVRQIRQVLGDSASAPRYVATVHRRGYRFIAPVHIPEAQVDPSGGLPVNSASRLAASPPQSSALAAPLMVAREAELTQLQQRWAQAQRGVRQVLFITGEAGIGKTTLVDTFVAQCTATEALWICRGQCIEHYGTGEAYLPLLEAVGQLAQEPEGSRLVALLQQYAPSWLLHMPALVSRHEMEDLQRRSSGTAQTRMLRELAEAVERLTLERTLVMVLEDLHWSDVSTIAWLSYMARRRGPARLLVLGTYRPVDAASHGHQVHAVAQELQRQGKGTELALGYLSAAEVETYLSQRFHNGQLATDLAPLLHQRTTGNPLFLVTVVKELLQRGVLSENGAGKNFVGPASSISQTIPSSLQHLIEQQFQRLPPDDQAVLQIASVVGVEFATATIAAVMQRPLEDIELQCAALARRGQFVRSSGHSVWPDGALSTRYAFLHALYHEVLYERLPVGVRQQRHVQIGRSLEAAYGA